MIFIVSFDLVRSRTVSVMFLLRVNSVILYPSISVNKSLSLPNVWNANVV